MPHYKDGQEAKVGDIVRGKGYNILHEVTGPVVAVKPGDTCNIEVGVADLHNIYGGNVSGILVRSTQSGSFDKILLVRIEYGECSAFELILRANP